MLSTGQMTARIPSSVHGLQAKQRENTVFTLKMSQVRWAKSHPLSLHLINLSAAYVLEMLLLPCYCHLLFMWFIVMFFFNHVIFPNLVSYNAQIVFWLNKMKFHCILISLMQSSSTQIYVFPNFIALCYIDTYIDTGVTPFTTEHCSVSQ